MCGITGFTNLDTRLSAGEAQSTISAMTASIKHRGPDNQGAWLSPDASIVLGHRRLSILDLSPAGAQPMTSHCERYTIVLNGEIYNYRDLQKELEAEKGAITFRGHSDTEILLEYIAHFGAQKALTAING